MSHSSINNPLAPKRFENLAPLQETIASWKKAGEHIVLVPTMGALHDGHLALVTRARELGQRVVTSLFVNPTQFGPNEDFSRYPRDTDTDLLKMANAGVDAVWMPNVKTMYPTGFASSIHVAGLTDILCGAYRPGHFSGVATVVAKLLNQVRPDTALFGEKDYQQLQVIRRMVHDFDMNVTIEGVPTVREVDGLAMSSRNRYLSSGQRQIAPELYATLVRVAKEFRSGSDSSTVLSTAIISLNQAGFSSVQYISICDEETLLPVETTCRPARVVAAVYLGTTRLIDNVPV